jgi:hypothetical protein
VIVLDRPWDLGMGVQMIIDLDSWEAGYADGELGRSFQCPPERDLASYSSGYREGRAYRSGVRRKAPRLRYARAGTARP